MNTETIQYYEKRHKRDEWILSMMLCLLLLGGTYWGLTAWIDRSQQSRHYVSVRWDGAAVVLSIPMDSPYQVTCLAYACPEGHALAVLPEPMYLISSGGKRLTESQIKPLIWRVGKKEVLAPTPGTPIWAMYARMNWSPEHGEKRRRP